MSELQIQQPIALSIEEAAAAARTGRTALYELIKRGEIRAKKRGKRTLILRADLEAWLNGLPAIAAKKAA